MKSNHKNIAVLCGGSSSEREISLLSGKGVHKAIIEFDQLFNIIIDKYHNDIDAPQLQNFSNPFQQYNPFR